MRGVQLTSEEVAKHILESGDTCFLIAPGVDKKVSEALQKRAQRGARKASVVIDGTHHAERSGYGETSTWRDLIEAVELKAMPGTRLGLLVTGYGAWLFAPQAGKLDPREEAGLNAVMLDAQYRNEARALAERILGGTGTAATTGADLNSGDHEDGQLGHDLNKTKEPRAHGETITTDDIGAAERAIGEHPPRDYAKEREITVYSAFVGYIELRLAGASLGKGARLKIPDELVERGLGENEVRKRINESVRIDLEEGLDLGVSEINERVNAIRTLYTRQLGEPHGRIYRKRQRRELEGHLDDLKKEIDQANSSLGEKIDAAVGEQLDDLARTYSTQITQGSLPELTCDHISRQLHKAWREAGATRPREVKLEVTFKDLTWESLQDGALKQRIVELFPDLKDSKLYREYSGYASPTNR